LISGVRGEPAPRDIKVCLNYLGGFRNAMTFVLTGLDVEEKAVLVRKTLERELGAEAAQGLEFELINTSKTDPTSNNEACSQLRVVMKSADPGKAGRAFSSVLVELALASYPGLFFTTQPGDATPYGVYWPTLVPAELVEQVVVLADGTRHAIAHTPSTNAPLVEPAAVKMPAVPSGPTKRVPLGTVIGARSGDKGGNANVGLWARSDAGYAWLNAYLTLERFRELLPEAAKLEIRRIEFPNLRSLNFVIVGLLGEGVSSTSRYDAQAKGLGEYLRARLVDLPESLLADAPLGST
jgi:hypothetical protein